MTELGQPTADKANPPREPVFRAWVPVHRPQCMLKLLSLCSENGSVLRHTIRERERKDEEGTRYSAHSYLKAGTDSASIPVKKSKQLPQLSIGTGGGRSPNWHQTVTLQLQPGDNDIAVQVRLRCRASWHGVEHPCTTITA